MFYFFLEYQLLLQSWKILFLVNILISSKYGGLLLIICCFCICIFCKPIRFAQSFSVQFIYSAVFLASNWLHSAFISIESILVSSLCCCFRFSYLQLKLYAFTSYFLIWMASMSAAFRHSTIWFYIFLKLFQKIFHKSQILRTFLIFGFVITFWLKFSVIREYCIISTLYPWRLYLHLIICKLMNILL